MHITVFGASGKVGQLVVEELLKRGHTVTAFVHSHDPFTTSKNLQIIKGDVHNEHDIEQALKHADAVVSTLGSWGTKQKDILTSAMQCIVPVMQDWKIKRIVSVTGHGIVLPGEQPGLVQRLSALLINIAAHKVARDGRQHILELQKSSLDWTVLRSPIMDNVPISAYLLDATPPQPWDKVGRKSVAKALCDLVESEMFVGVAPFIH